MYCFSVSMYRKDVEDVYSAVVQHDGTVRWEYPAIFHSACGLDVSNFPWDKQQCTLFFVSWSYSSYELELYNATAEGTLVHYAEDGVWRMIGVPAPEMIEMYHLPFHVVLYTIHFERKPLYYIFNLVLPCVILTMCGLLVFLLPPECGEKISMSVTMFLSSTMFLMLLGNSIPVQSNVIPLLGESIPAQSNVIPFIDESIP